MEPFQKTPIDGQRARAGRRTTRQLARTGRAARRQPAQAAKATLASLGGATFFNRRGGGVAVLLTTLSFGCAGGTTQFPLREPLWHDDDARPFAGEPEEYFSPFAWDAADQTLFRPLTRFFAVDPGGEAVNVNALDEVPDSSWYTNRLSLDAMTPAEFGEGPCDPDASFPPAPWTVIGAKPNGANPGFLIKDAQGQGYLVKFDGLVQGPRATAADVIVSKFFHAAGYTVPCNRVVFFDEGILTISPKAKSETAKGDKEPLTREHIRLVLDKAVRLPDGRYRASTSRFLDGKPIGPFTYQGTRGDDPNDVVPHEDRRELRAARVLSAWVNHFDAREQNTLDTWMQTGADQGYIRHNIIDFGDCLGSIWEPPMLGRRIGHAYYLDLGEALEDWLTFGLVERPWDTARFGPSGTVFGYFDVGLFEPEAWRPGYPNPAFGRMTERDAAWMARMIAKMTLPHLRAAIAQGHLDERLAEQLFLILKGRREKLLQRYLTVLSPLSHARVQPAPAAALCARDLAVEGELLSPSERSYAAAAWTRVGSTQPLTVKGGSAAGEVCVELGALAPVPDGYLVVDLLVETKGQGRPGPLRAHLFQEGQSYQLLGLERPETPESPL